MGTLLFGACRLGGFRCGPAGDNHAEWPTATERVDRTSDRKAGMTTNRGWDSIGVREVLLALGGAVCALALGVLVLVLLSARPAGASPLARPDIARSAAPGRVVAGRPSALPAALPAGPATSGAAGVPLSGSAALPPAPASGGAATAPPPTTPDASTVPTIGVAAGNPSGTQGLPGAAGTLPAAPQRLAPPAAAGGTIVGGALRVLPGTVGSAEGVARSAEGAVHAETSPISRTTPAPPSTARSGSTSSRPAIHAGPADAARPAKSLTVRVAPAGAAPGATPSTAAAAHDPNPARPGSPRPRPVSPPAPGSAPAVLDAGPGLGSHGGIPGVALAAAMALAMLVVGAPADRRRRPSTWIDSAFSPPG